MPQTQRPFFSLITSSAISCTAVTISSNSMTSHTTTSKMSIFLPNSPKGRLWGRRSTSRASIDNILKGSSKCMFLWVKEKINESRSPCHWWRKGSAWMQTWRSLRFAIWMTPNWSFLSLTCPRATRRTKNWRGLWRNWSSFSKAHTRRPKKSRKWWDCRLRRQ